MLNLLDKMRMALTGMALGIIVLAYFFFDAQPLAVGTALALALSIDNFARTQVIGAYLVKSFDKGETNASGTDTAI